MTCDVSHLHKFEFHLTPPHRKSVWVSLSTNHWRNLLLFWLSLSLSLLRFFLESWPHFDTLAGKPPQSIKCYTIGYLAVIFIILYCCLINRRVSFVFRISKSNFWALTLHHSLTDAKNKWLMNMMNSNNKLYFFNLKKNF